jgi:hypothetical protein
MDIIIIVIIQYHRHNPQPMTKQLSKDNRLSQNQKSVHTFRKQPDIPGGRTPSEGFTPLWDLGSDQLSTLAHGWLAATTKTITVKLLKGPHGDGTVRTATSQTGTTCSLSAVRRKFLNRRKMRVMF